MAVGSLPDEHVLRLASMLRRTMPCPFELTCIVDRPRAFPEAIRTLDASQWPPPRPGMRVTTYKLGLYDPAKVPFREFLYLDTSMIIRADMTPLLEFAFAQPHDLVAVRDWNYEAFNTSVMRIRQTERLAEISKAYAAGECFPHRVPGDQDFVTAVLADRGFCDSITTFPDEMIACFGAARRLSKTDRRAGYAMLEKAVIVKFNGQPKMDDLISPRYRLRQAWETKNPFHRRAWFWVKDAKELWR